MKCRADIDDLHAIVVAYFGLLFLKLLNIDGLRLGAASHE